MRATLTIFLSALAFILASCGSSGPDYVKPELQPAANYKTSTSSQLGISSTWWRSFRDPTLNSLQSQLLAQNPDLAAAYARRQQALARLGISEANVFPQASANGSLTRKKASLEAREGRQLAEYFSQYQVGANLSYELDLWGRVRRLVAAGKADAQAAVKTRQENLKIANDRLTAGITSELDAARAKSELVNARAELLSLKGPRAQLENSIAVLLGRQASNFRITKRSYSGYLPRVSAGLPIALLYRRPDVAVAERRVAAATARIGVAQAERLPKISLTGSSGSTSISSSKFLEWSSQFFSIGPSVSVPLFQGGRIKSGIMLLANLRALRAEASARKASVDAASRTYDLSVLRYKEGATSYLDVADAQREKLTAERAAVRTRGRQFTATIQLIQALGGGFSKGSK